MVCTERENATVKIIDFGTAMELEPGEQVSWGFENLYLDIWIKYNYLIHTSYDVKSENELKGWKLYN